MILRSSNPNHIQMLEKWGKANGVLRLNKFLPEATAFGEIFLINSLLDLEIFFPQLPKNYFYRRDSLIGAKFSQRVSKDGDQKNIYQYFSNMKNSNKNLSLLIIESKVENLPRYISNGAFNVSIQHEDSIIIELLGHGFDAREITHGLASHEIYKISWDDILFCDNTLKLENYKIHKVDEKTYLNDYTVRMEYLQNLNFDTEDIKKHLPMQYTAPSNFVKEKILNHIVLPIYLESISKNQNFDNHWVCGNITNKDELAPFEFSSTERIN
jgi:hypothetical protein